MNRTNRLEVETETLHTGGTAVDGAVLWRIQVETPTCHACSVTLCNKPAQITESFIPSEFYLLHPPAPTLSSTLVS